MRIPDRKRMSSHLATQQQLHRAIHPQPIPRIRNPQRLSRLVSRKPHLDNAMDSFPRRVLIRWGVEDIDLRRMLVEYRVRDLRRRAASAVA